LNDKASWHTEGRPLANGSSLDRAKGLDLLDPLQSLAAPAVAVDLVAGCTAVSRLDDGRFQTLTVTMGWPSLFHLTSSDFSC
jgi:hypothetical protein